MAEQNTVLRVAAVQWALADAVSEEAFFARVAARVSAAAAAGAGIVVFPEYFPVEVLSLHERQPPPAGIRTLANYETAFNETLASLAKEHATTIVAGTFPVSRDGQPPFNAAPVFLPDGRLLHQPKLHLTPAEQKLYDFTPGDEFVTFDAKGIRCGVQICYDVEFPEPSRALAESGVDVILVPYCTDDEQGHRRVRIGAQARAQENQCYVVTAGLCGSLGDVEDFGEQFALSGAYGPSDLGMPSGGVIAECTGSVEALLLVELDFKKLTVCRRFGAVRPRLDRRADLFQHTTSVKITNVT